MIELFLKIVNFVLILKLILILKKLIIHLNLKLILKLSADLSVVNFFYKIPVLDIWEGSQYASESCTLLHWLKI